MKHTLKRLFSAFLVSCLLLTMFPLSVFASSTNGSSIIEVLSRASKTGFYYNFDGDTSFDGSRIVSGTEQDISRLKASTQGTVIVRYRSTASTNQVLFAAGSSTEKDKYGAVMVNNVSGMKMQRIDFPGGMVANLRGTTTGSGWHTFVYSVDASDLTNTQAKSVTSFDGSTTTQFPNFASWFNYNAEVNDIQFLNIGGTSGALANSSNNANFVGDISFVAFLPEFMSQQEAAAISGAEWPIGNPLVFSKHDLNIQSDDDAVQLNDDVLETLNSADNITILVKYKNTTNGPGSLLSVSDTSKNDAHFHLYQSGNRVGFEFRKSDSPKYSAYCTTFGYEDNIVAFKAESGVGYKLFANGQKGGTTAKTGDDYQWLGDIPNLTTGYIGKMDRLISSSSYPYTGTIDYIYVFTSALSDELLLELTRPTSRNVFYEGDATSSTFFRIPYLLYSSKGTLVAGSDTNYGSTGDSAENIDSALRIKHQALSYTANDGWEDAITPDCLHMSDYADEYGYKQGSASFIDGVIVEDTEYTDRILLLIDAFAWNGGGFQSLNIDAYGQAHGGVARSMPFGDGFCTIAGHKYFLLSDQNVKSGNVNMNTVRSRFNYAADIYGEKNADGRYNVYHLLGTPTEYSSDGTTVDDSNLSLGELSEYSLGENYELYKDGQLLHVTQRSSDIQAASQSVPMKIFYEDSELQVYNTSYIMQVYSDDDGETWHTDKIISGMVKREESRYYLTGPGHGIQIQNGDHAGRLVVPIYYQLTGGNGTLTSGARTEVIYSDDGGNTWAHGDCLPGTVGHESVVVELPNGNLQIFMRNTSGSGGKIKTATSLDGGETWIDVTSGLGDNLAGTNSQLSALSYSGTVVSKKDGQAYPAVLLSMAYNTSRTDGRIYVGLIKENGQYDNGSTKYSIDWEYVYQVTEASALFAYSSLVELGDGRIGMIYEASPTTSWADGLRYMYYEEFTMSELTAN